MNQADYVEAFFNDLSEEDLDTLIQVVSRLDPLEIKDDAPVYSVDEIDLIQRFQDFAARGESYNDELKAGDNTVVKPLDADDFE